MNSNTNYNNGGLPPTLQKGAIVLCQHGFQGNTNTMKPLLNTLKNLRYNQTYKVATICENIIVSGDLVNFSKSLLEIKQKFEANTDANVFIRTLFADPIDGQITDQIEELNEMIIAIKAWFPERPVILVGYSKGGVVGCKYAIEYPNSVSKLVNIGTPHTDTVLQGLVNLIADYLDDTIGSFFGIDLEFIDFVIHELRQSINNLSTATLHNRITYKTLKEEWNALIDRPKFTVIATEAIDINGVFRGDGAVPVDSALADGFNGKNNNIISLIDDGQLVLNITTFHQLLGNPKRLFDKLQALVDSLRNGNTLEAFRIVCEIILEIEVQDGTQFFKLFHIAIPGVSSDHMLNNETVALRVIAGLSA